MRFAASSLTVALLSFASLVLAENDSDVLSLTANNFEATVDRAPLMLVEFFAPWCGHCKALAPHYEEAATTLKDKNIELAKVDCVAEPDLCQTMGVQGYPTLKVFKNGKSSDYNGPRQSEGIISYMVKQSLPAVSVVTVDNHHEFKSADKLVVVAYLASPTDAIAAEFSATADNHRDDYLFGLTTDKAAMDAAGVTAPAIVVFRQFDEPVSEYPYPLSSLTVTELEDWIKELSIPILDEVNGENYALYASSSKPLAYLFLDPTSENKESVIDQVQTVAQKYKSKLNFVWIDAVKFGEHAKALTLSELKWPAFVIQDLEKQQKFPLDQSNEITTENVGNWVNQFIQGKLQPQLKSQPIPETQDEHVYTLVGKNFDEVVFDDSKDVFVEFYATWCGHCKRLKPVWDNLAEQFADVKDRLVIAKMDAAENDLPPSVSFRIQGFPTIKLKPAGSREFIDYEGDRTIESLAAFVEEHAKNSLIPVETSGQMPLGVHSSGENSSAEARHDEL